MSHATLGQVNTAIQVRFSDTDMLGHISSGSYANWGEVGRAEFFEAPFFDSVRDEIPWFVMAHLALDFLSEGHFGESFILETRCEKLGTKSITIRQFIKANGRLVCEMKVVMVAFDRETRTPLEVPKNWKLS